MSKRTEYFRIALIIAAWIIFAGLCIEAGGFLVNMIATLFFTPEGAKRFWTEVDLSNLYHFNQSHYVTLTSIMVIAAILKALLFYFIVKMLHDKRLNLAKPFNEAVNRFILTMAYLSLGIGIFSFWGSEFSGNLVNQGVELPGIGQLRLAGADVWLFMGVILLVIAFIFKKAVEIQNENDLTV